MIKAKSVTEEVLHLSVGIEVNTSDGHILAAYFKFRDGKSVETKEFARGTVFADYDRQGDLLGVEILAPCKVLILDRIVRRESELIRQFVRSVMPSGLELAGKYLATHHEQ